MSQSLMSVSSLNTKIKSLLEATFMHTLVEGEVASVTYHTSGHLYFSIKDDKSSIKCVMWRSSVTRMKFRIKKGMQIVVEGSVSVYTPRGEYQFQTVRIEPSGQGALALAYEQLKKNLKAKGYFESSRKKILPKIPKSLALVTAKESAALHDMLKIIEKRWKDIEVTIVDTLVQGEQAGASISRALCYADTLGVDIVIVGRGGGSAEDLWGFNEEIVADAIYVMRTPVVSAVGHEVDTMISDFVADVRAPTPSAAIEMVLPDQNEILYSLQDQTMRYSEVIQGILYDNVQKLGHQEEMMLRLSPVQRLQRIEASFSDIIEQYRQVIEYKMGIFLQKPTKIGENFGHTMALLFKQKVESLHGIEQYLALNNPKLQSKEGWAEVNKEGEKIALDRLEEKDIFILSDAIVSIEAQVLNKKVL